MNIFLTLKNIFKNPAFLFFGCIFFGPIALFAVGKIGVLYLIAGIGVAVFISLLIANFETGFLALVFTRSAMDYIQFLPGAAGLNLTALVSGVLIVLALFYVIHNKIPPFMFEETVPFLLFLGVCLLSVYFSPIQSDSFADWLRLFSILAVYVLTRSLFRTPEKIRVAFAVVLLSALIPTAVAYFQLATGNTVVSKDFEYGRLMGTFSHPNAFASYLFVMLVFLSVQFFEKETLVPRRLLAFFLAATFPAFILTYSRGAWIVFFLSLGVMAVLRYRRLFVLIPVAVFALMMFVPTIGQRMSGSFQTVGKRNESAWLWRLDTWTDMMPLYHKKPLLGHGLDYIYQTQGVGAHNDYVRLLVETGALGFAAYVLLMAVVMTNTCRDLLGSKSRISQSFQVGLFAMLVGLIARQAADNTLRNTVIMIYVWIFIALSRNIRMIYESGNRRSMTDRSGGTE